MPRAVIALGLVSLCMDASSELIHSLLPLFMVGTLGASVTLVGLVEGLAEGTASFVKVGSGAFSDWHGRRKPLAVLGYGLGAASKVLFPLATSVGFVFAARFIDRIGKGIRGAPRDALVAEVTPPALHGRAFGLRQALDSTGAVVGPLAASALMLAFAGDFRTVFWFALIPAWVSVAVLVFGVHEPAPGRAPARESRVTAIAVTGWRALPTPFWLLLGVVACFGLARYGEAFLILAAEEGGLSAGAAPLAYALMSAVYAASAYPAGHWSDAWGRTRLLAAGLVVLALADVVLGLAKTPALVLLGAALFGLHMGLSQGLLAALVADVAGAQARGLAFGLYNAMSGLAVLVASLGVGAIWTQAGRGAAFALAAGLALVAAGALLLWARRYRAPA